MRASHECLIIMDVALMVGPLVACFRPSPLQETFAEREQTLLSLSYFTTLVVLNVPSL